MHNEIQLNFLSSNSNSDNLLVCLHGNSTDSNYFSTLFNGIDSWRVLAPDFLGHGKSPKLAPNDYNYEVFIQSLVDFINQFSYDKIVVVGHSMGGNLAIELLKVLELDGLLLLASPPVSYSRGVAPYLKLPDFSITEDSEENSRAIRNYLSESTSDQETIKYLSQTFLNTDPVFRERLLQEFAAMKFSDQLELLKQDNLTHLGCIVAKNDVVANNEYVYQIEQEGLFNYFDHISNVGHYSLLEKPQENKGLIEKFLENIE